jgi:hypothetical protein
MLLIHQKKVITDEQQDSHFNVDSNGDSNTFKEKNT